MPPSVDPPRPPDEQDLITWSHPFDISQQALETPPPSVEVVRFSLGYVPPTNACLFRYERMDSNARAGREEPVTGGSDRSFGVLFAIVSAVVGLWPLLDGQPPRGWALAVAGLLLAVALVKAQWLAPFNRVWTRFGLLLHRIVSPAILAIIYFAVVTPTGLVMRALGKDPLRLRRAPDVESYWIHRKPPGPERESMTRQF